MTNFINWLFRRFSSTEKPVPDDQVEEAEYKLAMKQTEHVQSYPPGFFKNEVSEKGIPDISEKAVSPVFLLMSAFHTSSSPAVRERLWASPMFRQKVAHVFRYTQPEDMENAIVLLFDNGYWRPMLDVMWWALEENLVGLSPEQIDEILLDAALVDKEES